MKKSLVLMSLLTLVAASARAEDPPPPPPFTGNISLTTNYKFRGQDQGTLKTFSPAVQGGFDWAQNGFYAGNWNSNVNFAGSIEMDFYAGYKGEIAKDVGYDVGIYEYYYPKNGGSINFNVTELYGAVSWQWLSLKYSHTVSSDYFGIGASQQAFATAAGDAISRPKGRNTGYLDLSANYPLVDKLTLNAHLGYTRLASDLRNATFDNEGTPTNIGLPSFYDYKLGLTYDLGSGFSVAGAVVGASKKSSYPDGVNKARAILTLSKSM
ncbi:MAG: TorF family putative porin [Caldimonas sp.]